MDAVRSASAGAVSAVAFVAGQLLAWRQLTQSGYFLTSSPVTSFFYLLTGVHGLHVLGGLVALRRSVARAWGGAATAQLRLSVELCAIYWHFLLLVCLIVFGLLLLTDPIVSGGRIVSLLPHFLSRAGVRRA